MRPTVLNATSTSFSVGTGVPSQLAFSTEPAGANGGSAFATQPIVTIEDAGGNRVTTATSTVTLSITTSTPTAGGPGTLTCTPTAASGGVATFTGCRIDTAGTGYQLHAADGSLAAADSTAFDVAVGPANQLVYISPAGATGGLHDPAQGNAGNTGAALSRALTQGRTFVTIEDAGGNIVTSDNSTGEHGHRAGLDDTVTRQHSVRRDRGSSESTRFYVQVYISGCTEPRRAGGWQPSTACTIDTDGRSTSLEQLMTTDGVATFTGC